MQDYQDCMIGIVECWKNERLNDCKVGRLQNYKIAKLKDYNITRLQNYYVGCRHKIKKFKSQFPNPNISYNKNHLSFY